MDLLFNDILIDAAIIQRFESFIDKRFPPCWIWKGCRNTDGYGTFSLGETMVKAHRFAYALCFGEIPPTLYVLHKCDNPSCCNPDHLELGNQSKNMLDCADRGRWGHKGINKGEKHGLAKLTQDQVKQIKFYLGCGLFSQQELARQFHVSQTQIGHIHRGQQWI